MYMRGYLRGSENGRVVTIVRVRVRAIGALSVYPLYKNPILLKLDLHTCSIFSIGSFFLVARVKCENLTILI